MKLRIRSKKAQFYIFTAIVLSVLAFTLVRPRETPLQKDDTFQLLHENYVKEASRAVDNALLNQIDMQTRFEDFNNNFKTYSNSKNIKFGFLGVVTNQNETIVHNKMNDDVELNYLTVTEDLDNGDITTINWSEQIQVEFNSNLYQLNFTEDITEVKGLFYAKSSNYEKIYVYN